MDQKRNPIKNVDRTKKYHFVYMGMSTLLSLVLVLLLYLFTLYHFRQLTAVNSTLPFQTVLVLATGASLLLSFLIIGTNVLAAHRIAGMHIKMVDTFNEIAAGSSSLRLRFRKEDRLEEVEDSFNRMMDALQKNFPE